MSKSANWEYTGGERSILCLQSRADLTLNSVQNTVIDGTENEGDLLKSEEKKSRKVELFSNTAEKNKKPPKAKNPYGQRPFIILWNKCLHYVVALNTRPVINGERSLFGELWPRKGERRNHRFKVRTARSPFYGHLLWRSAPF